jgi:hypothetical protein
MNTELIKQISNISNSSKNRGRMNMAQGPQCTTKRPKISNIVASGKPVSSLPTIERKVGSGAGSLLNKRVIALTQQVEEEALREEFHSLQESQIGVSESMLDMSFQDEDDGLNILRGDHNTESMKILPSQISRQPDLQRNPSTNSVAPQHSFSNSKKILPGSGRYKLCH